MEGYLSAHNNVKYFCGTNIKFIDYLSCPTCKFDPTEIIDLIDNCVRPGLYFVSKIIQSRN